MTREEHLYSMRGAELIKEADKLGVRVACNKTRTQLSEAKAKVIDRILAAEAAKPKTEEKAGKNEAKKETPKEKPVAKPAAKETSKPATKADDEDLLTPKRGALIEFNGEEKNICAWAEELGISPNTLYGRIYKLGWSVERAFTTPSKKK